MDAHVIRKEVTIVNKLGLHARAAAKFVTLASAFSSEISLARNGREVNGKSIMGIMMLAAGKGTRLTLGASGEDEHEAVRQLEQLIAERFGEDE
jgi:phosphocarrier protein HPr